MKHVLSFDATSAPSLAAGMRGGLSAYATDSPTRGAPTTLWLRLCDGRALRITVDMHDLDDWNEIGTLTFEAADARDAPPMAPLPSSWSHVLGLQKLVYDSVKCEAECGFVLDSQSGEQLVVVPGADVYTLAIEAPFARYPFSPENELDKYVRKPF